MDNQAPRLLDVRSHDIERRDQRTPVWKELEQCLLMFEHALVLPSDLQVARKIRG